MSGIIGAMPTTSNLISRVSGEWGSWSPVVQCSTSVVHTGTPLGHWKRLGEWVWLAFYAAISNSLASTGDVRVYGLPFRAARNENMSGYVQRVVGFSGNDYMNFNRVFATLSYSGGDDYMEFLMNAGGTGEGLITWKGSHWNNGAGGKSLTHTGFWYRTTDQAQS